MIQSIREHERIAGDLRKCGAITVDDKLLFISVTGENEQTYKYYAAEFSIDEDKAYYYVRSVPLNRFAWQCYLCKWQDGYAVICNNTQACSFRACISPNNAAEEIVEVDIDGIPWVYYLELPEDYDAGYQIEYSFLNLNGEEIN